MVEWWVKGRCVGNGKVLIGEEVVLLVWKVNIGIVVELFFKGNVGSKG